MGDPAQDELASLLAAQETQEAPQEATPVSTVEQVEYFLGDKANKLPVDAQFSFTENGKVVKTPLSTMLNHYRQRSALDTKFSEFNKNKTDFEAQQKEWGDLEPVRQLQKWSTDPATKHEFDAMWDWYQNKDKHLTERAVAGPDGQVPPNMQPLLQEMSELKKELGGLKEFKSQFDKEQEFKKDQENLQALEKDVDAFKKDFPELNLDQESDMILQDGKNATVKQAIMLFGYKNGIPDFESAALKYLKPKLLEIAAQRARSETVKAVRQDNKAGVIARSSTPPGGQSSKVNPKASWGDVGKAAKAELDTLLRG